MDEELRADPGTLRRWRLEDVPALVETVRESLDHLRPWMPWAAGEYDPAETAQFVEMSVAEWDADKSYNYAIVAPDGRIVGSAGLMGRIGPGALEIGYWLHPAYTGRGLATATARALVVAAWTRPDVDRVEIHHDERNERSGLIPRRLGFTLARREEGEGGQVTLVWVLPRP